MTYIYTMTKEEYSLTDSGKGFKSKPDTVETEVITEDQYRKITDTETLKFFRRLGGSEHATRCYTSAGYLITKLTSKSPCRDVKVVRKFKIEWKGR